MKGQETMSEGRLNREWFADRIADLRTSSMGEGYRLPAEYLHLRLQRLEHGTVGVMVYLSDEPKPLQGIRLVDPQVRKVGDHWAMALRERQVAPENQVAPFFHDLYQRLRHAPPESVASTVGGALESWRRAFTTRREILTEEAMRGLFGELQVLRTLARRGDCGADSLVTAWTGPANDDHDFCFPGRFHLECKTTTPASEKLRISNEHQLEAVDLDLYLVCVRAEKLPHPDPGSEALPDLVEEAQRLLSSDSAIQLLWEKFEDLGFQPWDGRYRDHHFRMTSMSVHPVGPETPRIIPSDLRPGVANVRYQINTSSLEDPLDTGIPLIQSKEE